MKLLTESLINGAAIGIRLFLSAGSVKEFLTDRVEVSSPVNSFKRLLEGIDLNRKGISPYSGDIFHEMPLTLYGFGFLIPQFLYLLPLMMALLDVLGALFLSKAAFHYVNSVNKCKPKGAGLELFPGEASNVALLVRLCFLFNPFIIAACVAQTTSVIHNLCLAIAIWSMITDREAACLISLALATYQGFYPVVLIAPVALTFAKAKNGDSNARWMKELIRVIGVFLGVWGALLYLSSVLFESWAFIEGTYGFLASVPDLTPNVGLFWYFFTEMFDHFRLFFLWVFQVNLIVYIVPLSLCLRDDPFLLFNELLMVMAVFKSYPSVADAGLYLSLLPAWRHLYRYIRHGFVVGCAVLCCTVLAPVMWFLWIHAGSANANFYFAITLVYSTAQIFLLTDMLYAHLRRKLHLKHGMDPLINGKKAKIVLE